MTTEETAQIHDWRVGQLYRAVEGLDYVTADKLADEVDYHDVARLISQGCPPELALEIAR